jgi:hypothetical protein
MTGELEEPMFSVRPLFRSQSTNMILFILQVSLQRDTIDISGHGMLTVGKLPDGIDNSSLTWVPVRLYSPEDGGMSPPTFAPEEVCREFYRKGSIVDAIPIFRCILRTSCLRLSTVIELMTFPLAAGKSISMVYFLMTK